MAQRLLHTDFEPLSVLLSLIVVKNYNNEKTKASQKYHKNVTQKPVAKLESYYKYAVKGIKRDERANSIEIGSDNEVIQLGPVLGRVSTGQWLDLRTTSLRIENAIPRVNQRNCKLLSCEASGGWIAIVGQNGIVIVDKAIAVANDSVFIIRRNGVLVTLEKGAQDIDLGPGGHLVLFGFGAIVVIPGKGWIKESHLIYTCIRPEFLGETSQSSYEQFLLHPILRVYAGYKCDFYIVQVRQRLLVVKSESWNILISENFWQFEFQTFFKFYRVLANRGINYKNDGIRDQTFIYPEDIVVPIQSLQELGQIIPHLVFKQNGKNRTTTKFEITPNNGHILLLQNCDHFPSSVVVPEGSDSKLIFERKGLTHGFIMTTRAMFVFNFSISNENIRELYAKNLKLSTVGSLCHICLVFTNGFILMVGADQYL